MTRVSVDHKHSEEHEVKVGMHKGSVPLPLLFAALVDVVTELAREDISIVTVCR